MMKLRHSMRHAAAVSVRRDLGGFTLIELVIVIAIIAILATIALPSYTQHIRSARRAQAKADMLQTVQTLERWYSVNRDYTTATTICGVTTASPTTGTAMYSIAVACPTRDSYNFTATPTGPQSIDVCGTLALSSVGLKSHSAGDDATCAWGGAPASQ